MLLLLLCIKVLRVARSLPPGTLLMLVCITLLRFALSPPQRILVRNISIYRFCYFLAFCCFLARTPSGRWRAKLRNVIHNNKTDIPSEKVSLECWFY